TAAIPASDLAAVGTAQVTVVRSGPLGGTSGALTFSINNPVPAVSSLAPASAQVGGAAFTLTVNGTGFTSASTVRWNGAARTTTFVSATQLTAAIAAADIATAASVPVTVLTPAPGGGTSAAQTFSVSNPAPTLTSVSPTSATTGDAAITFTVIRSSFGNGSTVRWNGGARTTTFVSGSQLMATISAADVAAAGTAQITVATPAPGGGTSGSMGFAITVPSTVNVGLAGYWRFDECGGISAGDSTGLAGAGMLVNGPVWTSGRLGQAIAFDGVDDGSGCPMATGGYADNQWHQVAFVVDASGGRLYVDGVSRATRGWTGTPGAPTTTLPLQVGRYESVPAPNFFAGVVDDVRVYGRALRDRKSVV